MLTPPIAMTTPTAAPASVSTRFSARSNRRSRPAPAPIAARTTSSCSRRTPRMSVRFATFAAEMSRTNAAAPMRSQSVRRARSPSTSRKGMTRDAIVRPRIVRILELTVDSRADRGNLGTGLGDRRAGSEPGDHLGHTVGPALHHQRTRVVLADHHIEQCVHVPGKNGAGWSTPITVADCSSSLTWRADDARVSAEAFDPVVVGQHHHSRDAGAVVTRPGQPAKHRGEPHDVEVVPGHEPHVEAHGVGVASDGHGPGENSAMPARAGVPFRKSRISGTGKADVFAARPVGRLPQVHRGDRRRGAAAA